MFEGRSLDILDGMNFTRDFVAVYQDVMPFLPVSDTKPKSAEHFTNK